MVLFYNRSVQVDETQVRDAMRQVREFNQPPLLPTAIAP
jgi:hypothetical protein